MMDVMRIASRVGQLYVGLALYGSSAALQVRSGLGLDPWDVFHQGLSERTGLSLGAIVIIVGALVLLAWIPLRQRPGFGTLSNVVVLGLALDATLAVVPQVHSIGARIVFLSLGILLNAVATGLYIGAGFGAGPRDGMALGVARVSGRSIRLVRTCIEMTVLSVGWVLGGTVGVGTLAYALLIGPLSQFFLRLLRAAPRTSAADQAGERDQSAERSAATCAPPVGSTSCSSLSASTKIELSSRSRS
jgi:uncharacterized membrane protein YczE